MNKSPHLIIVGGGAAGMAAAIAAAEETPALSVTVYEPNNVLGRKLRITGKGRCNVTNDCDQDEFLKQVPRNPRFLYSAMSHFSPQNMMALLEKAGCPVVVQRGRRVFGRHHAAGADHRHLDRRRHLRQQREQAEREAEQRALLAYERRQRALMIESFD